MRSVPVIELKDKVNYIIYFKLGGTAVNIALNLQVTCKLGRFLCLQKQL